MDLVKLVMDQLSPQLIGKMVGAIGTDRAATQNALGAAVPAVLSGLVGVVQKPGGSEQLSTMLQQVDSGIVGHADTMLGSGQQQSLIDQGIGMLSSLLGGSTLGSLAAAVGKFAGMGDGQAKSLLGMAAPIVLGMLGGQQKSQGLDAGGLAQMLLGQKDTIANAVPSGFGNLIGGTDLLAGIADRAGQVGAEASQAAQAASIHLAKPVRDSVQPAAVGWSWRWPAIVGGLVLLALLGYWLLAGRGVEPVATPTQETTPSATATSPEPAEAVPNLTVGDVDLGARVTTFFNNARTTFEGVTNANSAQTALPKVNQMATELDQISGLAGQLPAEGKQALTSLISAGLPTLQGLIDKAMAVPAVAPILKPVVDPLKTKLATLAEA